jgi:hypothetical protein
MNRSTRLASAITASLCFSSAGFAASVNSNQSHELIPTGKGYGVEVPGPAPEAVARAKPSGNNGILYHGGPLMLGTTNVYYIWYGNWSGNSAVTILSDLMQNMGGSPIYNTNTSYYNGSNVRVSNSVSFGFGINDNYSLGTSLTDANIQTIVANAISSGQVPKQTNAVYFVLTSADVRETSGFGSSYCGWHTHGTIAGSDIKYAFVGDATTQAPTGCIDLTASSAPNGNMGADGMASVIFHELSEAVTDPDLNAWYDRRGNENADKCAWTFGTTYAPSPGKTANVRLGSRDFLLQQNWINASGGYCSLSF